MRARCLLFLLLFTAAAGCRTLERNAVEAAIERRRDAAELKLRTTTVDGRRVAYLEHEGAPGAPTVLLLHGFGASKDHWIGFADALPWAWRVLVPDLPGHGGSDRDSSLAYGAEDYAAAVEAWRDVVAPGLVHVAGNSLGGEVAVRLALRRPHEVESLALYAPAGLTSPRPSAMDSLAARGTYVLVPTDRAGFDRLFGLAVEAPPDVPDVARGVLAAQMAERAPFLRRSLAALAAEQDALRPRLREVAAPTLLVWGAQDRILDPSVVPAWRDSLRDVRVEVMPATGHAPMLERPAETAARYTAFVEDVLGADALGAE